MRSSSSMPRRKPSRKSSTSGSFRGARTSWTARTTTATEQLPYRAPTTELAVVGAGDRRAKAMTLNRSILLLISLLVAGSAGAQGVREHTRPAAPKGTAITESQATALTLTLG